MNNVHYNHCVPTWNNNFEDVAQVPTPPSMPPPPPSQPPTQSLSRSFTTQSHSTSLSTGPYTSMLDYEMAELIWENGQLTMHGLGIPRVPSISNIADAVGWDEKTISRANDTLESVFIQGYYHRSHKSPIQLKGACEQNDDDRVPLFDPSTPIHHVPVISDALVPSNNNKDGCSTQEGSCSTAARVPLGSDWSMSMSVPESLRRKAQTKDTCEQILSVDTTNNKGFTSTSFGVSPIVNTKTFTIDDNDSTSQSRPKRARDEEDENQNQDRTKSTISTKRRRAAAVHNQSERKRRDKINQRMKTLQKLVPNSNKVDKASILDEVIEYLKQLQAQVQMLSRMSLPLPSMMMPLAIQHQLQMPMNMNMMNPLNMGMNIRMGIDQMNMGMNSMIGRPNINAIQPPPMNMAPYNIPLATCDGSTSIVVGDCLLPQGPLPSTDPLLTYLTCGQSLPMAMDAYNRMAAMYQQLQQQTLQQQRQNHQQHEHAPGNYNI